jgi:hypothetical protein
VRIGFSCGALSSYNVPWETVERIRVIIPRCFVSDMREYFQMRILPDANRFFLRDTGSPGMMSHRDDRTGSEIKSHRDDLMVEFVEHNFDQVP